MPEPITPLGDVPAEAECASCGGRVELLPRVSRERYCIVYHYRCQGECREGGHISYNMRDGVISRRAGPVFDDGAARAVDEPDDRTLIADGGTRIDFGSAVVERNGEQTLVSASNEDAGIEVAIAVDTEREETLINGGELHRRLGMVVEALTEDLPEMTLCDDCEGAYRATFLRTVLDGDGNAVDLCPHCRGAVYGGGRR